MHARSRGRVNYWAAFTAECRARPVVRARIREDVYARAFSGFFLGAGGSGWMDIVDRGGGLGVQFYFREWFMVCTVASEISLQDTK